MPVCQMGRIHEKMYEKILWLPFKAIGSARWVRYPHFKYKLIHYSLISHSVFFRDLDWSLQMRSFIILNLRYMIHVWCVAVIYFKLRFGEKPFIISIIMIEDRTPQSSRCIRTHIPCKCRWVMDKRGNG